MSRGASVVALLFALLVGLCAADAARAAQPVAVGGRMELAADPAGRMPLQGQWGFAWHEFVDPQWQQLPAGALATVPSSWNGLTAAGKPPGPDGWGSYFLRVDCPAGHSLAVEPVGQRTAARVFVNGTLVGAHGTPGPSHEAGWAAVYNRVPISREFACPLRITVHLSNFDHRAGGFVRPMYIGTADALARSREGRVAYDAALLAAYVFTGVVGLTFFAVRRRERTSLLFGLFCIFMGVYSDLIGERLLLRDLPPQVSWFWYMRAEYLSWIVAMALFFATLRDLFPAQIHRRAAQAVLGALAAGALATLGLPPQVYSYMAVPGDAIALLVSAYVAVAMLRARGPAKADARVLLIGMLAVVAAFALDFLLIDVPGPDRKFSPIGFALFLLSPAVVIARRMSHALNAEERNRTLEENARLREDVERMSRHDLKTPLNSVIGATRLLRDDPQLAPDQRALADVIQRAALRMLELVNLSLGLFRMEKGTYEFQPQPVDLHALVDRLLVDLRSYAASHEVKLRIERADAGPVYAHAEELLCYTIVANLLKNAIEAAGPGREVAICVVRGDPVALTVHNPGEVPPALAARFFDKYVTVGKSGGTGLGTYSARLMARVQEGDLTLRTGPVEGTTLTLTLRPLVGAAPPAPPPLPLGAPPASLRGLRPGHLLLVDDDEVTRFVMQRFLSDAPLRVATAADGLAAVEAMERSWPDYLLIDMEMPRQGGIETVRWVRAQEAQHGRPRCRVLVWSGNDDQVSADRARGAGADRFLVKPVSREALVATLLELEPAGPAAAAIAP